MKKRREVYVPEISPEARIIPAEMARRQLLDILDEMEQKAVLPSMNQPARKIFDLALDQNGLTDVASLLQAKEGMLARTGSQLGEKGMAVLKAILQYLDPNGALDLKMGMNFKIEER